MENLCEGRSDGEWESGDKRSCGSAASSEMEDRGKSSVFDLLTVDF